MRQIKGVTSGLLVIALMVQVLLTSTAWAVPIKNGTPCKKLGNAWIFGAYTYTCIKSGKKLVWGKGVLSTELGLESSASPTPSRVFDPVETEINPIVSDQVIDQAKALPVVTILAQQPSNSVSSNGKFPEIAKNTAINAINFYNASGFFMPSSEYIIIMGRTQTWMRSELSLNECQIPPALSDGTLTSSWTLGRCGFRQNKLFTLISMAAKATNSYSGEEWASNVDLNRTIIPVYAMHEFEMQAPHGLVPIWQDEFSRANQLRGPYPIWFLEGVPQLLAIMSNSKNLGEPAFTYFDEYAPFFWVFKIVNMTVRLEYEI